jgi:hypothetical protein
MDKFSHEWMDIEWVDEYIYGWKDGWLDGWGLDGYINV